jgi:hypothetical protein
MMRTLKRIFASAAIICASACGSSTSQPTVPQFGSTLHLRLVDGHALPAVVESSASDQTVVSGGTAVMGEAIASGPYMLSLRHTAGSATDSSTVSGTTNLVANGSQVTASIDLGAALGTHTFTFSF